MGENIKKKPVGEPTTDSLETGIKKTKEKEKRTEALIIAQAEAASLVMSKALMYNRNLIEANLDPLVTIGPDGIITDVNKATENITGLPRERLIGTNFSAYFTDPDKAKAGYEKAFREGVVSDYELALKHISGHTTPVLYNASVYRDEEGLIIGVFAAARDITATQKAKNELTFQYEEKDKQVTELGITNKDLVFQKKEQAKMTAELIISNELIEAAHAAMRKVWKYTRSLIEASLDPLVTIGPDGIITDVNTATENATGLHRDKLIGTDFSEYFTDPRKAKAIYQQVFNEGKISDYELELKHISGNTTSVLYNASVYKDDEGRVIGVVAAARDITDRKKAAEEILHLSYHDQLTGVYNRRFYAEELKRLDIKRNLPLSLVMGDVNGLKLINDSVGHIVGDELLKKVAEILKKGCRSDDIVARHGGDEFVIILPKTTGSVTENIIKGMKALSLKEKVAGFDISIAFGYATKEKEEENIQEIFIKAEDCMYRNKLYESPSLRGKAIELIMNTIYAKSNREHLHSIKVGEICEMIANKMKFDRSSIIQIRTAGIMHDIGKIGIKDEILNNPRELTPDERNEIKKHPEIGYRILSSVNEFSEIADQILQHHEQWNGEGYPKGLKGEEIVMQARIISIAEAFDAMTSDWMFRKALSEEEAINEIKRCSGTKFDPTIARVFIEMVLEKDGETLPNRS